MVKQNPLGINPNEYWCHHVYRVEKNGKPFIGALVRRKYGDGFEDVDENTPTLRIGIELKGKRRKIWDNDPNSPTFQKRIEDPNQEEDSDKIDSFTIPMTEEVVNEIGKMCGVSNFATTQYFRLYHGKPPIESDSLEELSNVDNKTVFDEYYKLLKITKENKSK